MQVIKKLIATFKEIGKLLLPIDWKALVLNVKAIWK